MVTKFQAIAVNRFAEADTIKQVLMKAYTFNRDFRIYRVEYEDIEDDVPCSKVLVPDEEIYPEPEEGSLRI